MQARTGSPRFSRRDFLVRTATVGALAILRPNGVLGEAANPLTSCPVAVFSKVYQELKLGFAEAARLTAEAGLDGVDCPVRDGGEIEPEAAADQLPEYARVLRSHGLGVNLITSGIVGTATPHAERVLRAARQVGVVCYRLGYFKPSRELSPARQAAEVRAQWKDLAALNREVGVCGLFQNHGGSFGAHLPDLLAVVKQFDPRDIGVAFDIGHAIAVHGAGWRTYFQELRSHLRVAYFKDVTADGKWVRFGEGEVAGSGYLPRLKEMGYSAPISLHIEFDWARAGTGRNRESLGRALSESTTVLRRWLREA
jgi:sugar phosphate isomerase/epimerase